MTFKAIVAVENSIILFHYFIQCIHHVPMECNTVYYHDTLLYPLYTSDHVYTYGVYSVVHCIIMAAYFIKCMLMYLWSIVYYHGSLFLFVHTSRVLR